MNDITASDAGSRKLASARQLTMITYILYAVSLVVGITGVVAIIVNYVKREDMRGTIYDSHFTWQIRTFWWSMLWAVVGFVTMFLLVGFVVLAADVIWFIYRLVKGFLAWNDGKPMPV